MTSVPLRTCILCRSVNSKHELVRIVRLDSAIVIDQSGKMDGRGVYVCTNTHCLKKLINEKVLRFLSRSLKIPYDKQAMNSLAQQFTVYDRGSSTSSD